MRLVTFILTSLIALLIGCNQTDNANQISRNSESQPADTIQSNRLVRLFGDTSKIIILTKPSDIEFAFRKDYEIYNLNSLDLNYIETSIFHSIDSFNIEGKIRLDRRQRELGPSVKIDRNYFIIDTSRYKFQVVAAIDEKNEKVVWVNAFCDDGGRNWRTDIVATKDGGICYFNSSLNLTTGQIIYFAVNGDV